jgi:ABC-type bacteriocin/lantibiotic exporter with double-glycine peptidase domain
MAGVRGSKLSGGERQRIALARSIIRNGKYLLLDEATCGLDEENERMIKDCLRKLCKNIGCIEITHKI